MLTLNLKQKFFHLKECFFSAAQKYFAVKETQATVYVKWKVLATNQQKTPLVLTLRWGYAYVLPENEQSPWWLQTYYIWPGHLEATRRIKHLKVDDKSIQRRNPKREIKQITWEISGFFKVRLWGNSKDAIKLTPKWCCYAYYCSAC